MEFLYHALGEDRADLLLRMAEWHAEVGDPATALILHEGVLAAKAATPESRVHMATQALRCFQRERALDLLGRALKERPELESRLGGLELWPEEVTGIRPPRPERARLGQT